MKLFLLTLIGVSLVPFGRAARKVTLVNNCAEPTWIRVNDYARKPHEYVYLTAGQSKEWLVPTEGFEGDFMPQFGCNPNGNDCAIGPEYPEYKWWEENPLPSSANSWAMVWFARPGTTYHDGSFAMHGISVSEGFYASIKISPLTQYGWPVLTYFTYYGGGYSCREIEFVAFPCPTESLHVSPSTTIIAHLTVPGNKTTTCQTPCSYVSNWISENYDNTLYDPSKTYCCDPLDVTRPCILKSTNYWKTFRGDTRNWAVPVYNGALYPCTYFDVNFRVTISCP